MTTTKHPTKKWEISIMEFQTADGKRFKVTRRLPALFVAQTKIFLSKKKALRQFQDWLH